MRTINILFLIIATIISLSAQGFCGDKINVPISEYDFRIDKIQLSGNFDINSAKESFGKLIRIDGMKIFEYDFRENISENEINKFDKVIYNFEKGSISVINKKIQSVESRKRGLKTPRQIAVGCSYEDVLKAYGRSDSEKNEGSKVITKGKPFECYYSYQDIKTINFSFDNKGTLTAITLSLDI